MKKDDLVVHTVQCNTIYQHINVHRFKKLQFRHYSGRGLSSTKV